MGMLDVWQTEGQQVAVDFLLPTGIYLRLDVSQNDTIAVIKKVSCQVKPYAVGLLNVSCVHMCDV